MTTPPTKQPAIDIDALTDRELDALVAAKVMGWERAEAGPAGLFSGDPWTGQDGMLRGLPEYSTDANRVREVEAEIERRGLELPYVDILVKIVLPTAENYRDLMRMGVFALITATPEQRCRAAYRAVMG
jgi:hypothetical protein